MSAPESARLPVGRIVAGRYTIRRAVEGARGFGRHVALTEPNREVLLDVLACDAARVSSVIAVLEETRARLADLPAHRVVPVLDVGADAGFVFVASALPPEPSLAELVTVCPLGPDETLQLARALAAALGAMHRAGVLHLGLDASGVFVPPLVKGTVALAGAGIARAVTLAGGAAWDALDAPELAGGAAAATAATDVHGAARLLLLAATGLEGTGESSLPSSMREVLRRARDASVEARPASVDALADALADALEGRPPRSSRTMPVPPPVALPPPPPSSGSSFVPVPPPPSSGSLRLEAPAPEPASAPSFDASVSPFAVGGSSQELPELPESTPPPRRVRRAFRIAGVAVAIVLVVAGGVVLRRSRRVEPVAAPGNTVTLVAAAQPAPPPSATPAPSAAPPPSATVSAEPAPLGPKEAELTVVCTPDCEKVLANGKPLSGPPDPVRLPAGTYGVGVGRAGYGGQWKKVVLRPGARETVSFTLTPVRARPRPKN